jgi:hypothetical protein
MKGVYPAPEAWQALGLCCADRGAQPPDLHAAATPANGGDPRQTRPPARSGARPDSAWLALACVFNTASRPGDRLLVLDLVALAGACLRTSNLNQPGTAAPSSPAALLFVRYQAAHTCQETARRWKAFVGIDREEEMKASHRSVKRSLVGYAGHLSDNRLSDGFSDFRKCGRAGGQISGGGFGPAKKPAEAGFLPNPCESLDSLTRCAASPAVQGGEGCQRFLSLCTSIRLSEPRVLVQNR